MKRIGLIPVIILLFATSCSSDEEQGDQASTLTKQSLIGTWVWQTAQVTDASHQQSGILAVNEPNCFESDIKDRLLCRDTESNIVEECQTLVLFDITFETNDIYDINENYSNRRIQEEVANNCAVILHDNERSNFFTSGTWNLEEGTITLNQTYKRSEITLYGENLENERLESATNTWKVISFSYNKMRVFWRTLDQIDYEITFVKN